MYLCAKVAEALKRGLSRASLFPASISRVHGDSHLGWQGSAAKAAGIDGNDITESDAIHIQDNVVVLVCDIHVHETLDTSQVSNHCRLVALTVVDKIRLRQFQSDLRDLGTINARCAAIGSSV